ncbi:MAG TPA: DNA topoisomerase IV subunit A [Candidatus Binatia bacterium]|nr:DNA topoisomerase IV subunit A [Candidatus Binatia bacterium]
MGTAAPRPIEADLGDAAEERYLSYALSVITSRALPDVRDGLKPVQRRILYAMFQNLRLTAGARPRKSAAVVGEVLGKYHPHGDQAAYEAMVRMAQPFALRYPLVQGEGNFGSLDGDGAAAMRYTEARLTPLAEEMLHDLGADTVPLRANYDATIEEPVVLPSAIPQLLMNGSTGIAVGMATNVPPHNLGEIVAALVALIDEPDLDVKGLLKHLKGPDFPTGGEILNSKKELRELYETGQGAVRLRGQYAVETLPRGKRQVVITSIPYTVNKAELVEQIAEHIVSRKLPLVVDVRDESTTDVRIVLELKSDANADAAMAYLYKHTNLQTNFNVNLTCLLPTANPAVGQPARVTLRELCRHFLDFRLLVVTRRLEHEKRQLEARLHVLDALAKIYDDLDRAIRIIRKAESRADAAKQLMAAFELDQVQADAILEIRLYQLARLEIEQIREERAAKRKRLREVEALLAKPRERWKLVRAELVALAEKYGDERRTVLSGPGEELAYDPEVYIVHEDATVVLSRDGWVKRVRELKDPTSTRLREGDALFAILAGTTRDRLVLFSTKGTMYVMRVADVPATTGYGEPVQSLLKFGDGARVVAARLVREPDAPPPGAQGTLPGVAAESAWTPAVLVATARGFGFRAAPDLSETTRAGRKLARVVEGDEIVSVEPILGPVVVVATERGKMLRFGLDEVAELSGPGRGVILMRPEKGREEARIVGALALPKDAEFVAVTDEGSERRLEAGDVPPGKRGGKGQRVVKRGRVAALRRPEAEG